MDMINSSTHIKTPQFVRTGGLGIKTLAMTYSRMLVHTTIGAVAFHFRVRDGNGWCHNAMITRERVEGRIGIGLADLERSRSQRVQLKLDMDVVR